MKNKRVPYTGFVRGKAPFLDIRIRNLISVSGFKAIAFTRVTMA